ncbi:MAG: serine hydrolase [Bacteroidia bacterium]|nr:serine hydrolase [Bacteroidia bacterium]MCF8426226.1 serine hydrolase [Bacteroidia bacterium]MCF8447859.1 serine hydrolase [Bacteroidia bacterium]
MKKFFLLLFGIISSLASMGQTLYFPPLIGKTWESKTPEELGWCASKTDTLYNYLEDKNTKGFLVLKDGRIVLEKYFGTFTQDSFWYWASAGKTMTSFLVGIAQQKGLLNIHDTSSTYLGKGWTSLTAEQEAKIKVLNQLSMSSGLDDYGVNKDCTFDSCLVYKSDAGTRWAYHNAPYTLLDKVIESATGNTFQQFFNNEVRNKTGILGIWLQPDFNNVLYSNARSMARFGLLLLNHGKWDQTEILTDTAYFRQMTNSSQNLNPSYGYLTWLNGKGKLMVPTSQIVFNTSLAPNAPPDMFAAMGKNGQLINVVPSMNLVMVRIGEAPGDNGEVPITFNNEIWFYLNKVICSGSNALAEEFNPESIALYPNPAQSVLSIGGLHSYSSYEIKLIGIKGEIVREGLNQNSIDISDLELGCYLICIEQGGKKLYKKFVKN